MRTKVTCIPPTKAMPQVNQIQSKKKLRVAAYARVSTDYDEQQTSFDAQVDYYSKYIRENKDWDFAGMYTDEGISATSTKNREGFNRMIKDALAGKIDRVITKSVSRFARNTVDTLSYVRKLKEKGVEVYFEKENINTMDSKGELLITIMSSLAQEESRSLSENVTWGQRKRFADGKVTMPYKQFLGYCKGADGKPEIVEEEADIIRRIYKSFLQGMTISSITKSLTADEVTTPRGGRNWSPTTVRSILTNEKYKGDALLQKTFTVDFLTKKLKTNEGEVPQYYVENSHPAIIEGEVFDLIQEELKRRRQNNGSRSYTPFSDKMICASCGHYFGRKVWHSTDKYRSVLWQCNHKFKTGEKCKTPHIPEERLVELATSVLNEIITDKDELLESCEQMLDEFFDLAGLQEQFDAAMLERTVLYEQLRSKVKENSSKAQEQDKYQKEFDALNAKYDKAVKQVNKLSEALDSASATMSGIRLAMKKLHQQDKLLESFDDGLWQAFVSEVLVAKDKTLTFKTRNGQEFYRQL